MPFKTKCFQAKQIIVLILNLLFETPFHWNKNKSPWTSVLLQELIVLSAGFTINYKLEKLWFNSEMGLLRPLPWQPAAPFAKACALNRTSYTSSFPIKTQKKKNRSTPRRRNHKSRKATGVLFTVQTAVWRGERVENLFYLKGELFPLGAVPLMILKVSRVFLFGVFSKGKWEEVSSACIRLCFYFPSLLGSLGRPWDAVCNSAPIKIHLK